jgi:hypothetical protein
MARQGRFLSRRQFARPVTTPPTGAHLPGSPPPDQRLVDIRHADPEHRGHRPRRHAAVNGHQNPRPQVLRIALTLPPSHRRPQHLVVWAANHTFPRSGIPFGDSGQCGNALEFYATCVDTDVYDLPTFNRLSGGWYIRHYKSVRPYVDQQRKEAIAGGNTVPYDGVVSLFQRIDTLRKR